MNVKRLVLLALPVAVWALAACTSSPQPGTPPPVDPTNDITVAAEAQGWDLLYSDPVQQVTPTSATVYIIVPPNTTATPLVARKVGSGWQLGCLDLSSQFVSFADETYGPQVRQYFQTFNHCPTPFKRGDALPTAPAGQPVVSGG